MDGTAIIQLKKDHSLFGRRFSVNKLSDIDEDKEDAVILGLMMMILMERRRG